MVKLNDRFRGVCPSCAGCTGMIMIDLYSGEYICARDCYHFKNYQRAYWERRNALRAALRRREELHARFSKEREAARLQREKELEAARLQRETDAINQVPWGEPYWCAGEFPDHYKAGWKIEFRKTIVDGKLIEQARHIKGDRVVFSPNGAVYSVSALERD